MEKHVTVVGVLRIGFGILGLLGAICVFSIAILTLAGTIGPGVLSGDEETLAILTLTGSSVALLLVGITFLVMLLSIPGIIGGIGLLKFKPWARILVLILAVLDLPSIPIGTAVGIYTIWVLMQDETEQLFASVSNS